MSITDVQNNNIEKLQDNDKDNNESSCSKITNEKRIDILNKNKTENSSKDISLKKSDECVGSINENEKQ